MTYKILHTAVAILFSVLAFGQSAPEENAEEKSIKFRMECIALSVLEDDEWSEAEDCQGVFHLDLDQNEAKLIVNGNLYQYDLFDISYKEDDTTFELHMSGLDDDGDILSIVVQTSDEVDFDVVYFMYDKAGLRIYARL